MSEEKKNDKSSSVIRVHKTKNFTVMNNKHLFQKDLSLKAKGLMSVFLALPDDWDYSIAGLCKIGKEGKDAINATISELKKHGYIEIERKNAERGRFVFEYHIFEGGRTDSPHTDFPYTVEPYTEQPNTAAPSAVEPNSENPQQINTNKSNTKKQNTKKEVIKNIFGEFQNVSLSEAEEIKLKDLYKLKFNEAIEKLSSYKYASGKKYKSDYAVLNKHNWVYKSIFPNGDNVREFPTQPRNEGKYSNCYQ